jgi:hypothetical protein
MSAQIIQFAKLAAAARAKEAAAEEPGAPGALTRLRAKQTAKLEARLATPKEKISITAWNKNQRDRLKDAWRKAEAVREYWRAKIDMESAVSSVQSFGLPEGQLDAAYSASDRYAYVDSWRAAIAKQMKTQSPDIGAVAWKKGKLSDYTFRDPAIQKECQRIIAADTKWLMDHPTRCDAFKGKRGKRT